MKIKSVEFKNIASYGNQIHKIEFGDVGDFYLIVGANGSGKSTIANVIKFGIYGRLQDKSLKDIPNRFNANGWCRIVIEKNPHTIVTIERSTQPSTLDCWVNGIKYDQAGKKNIQAFIEDEVIGLSFYVFNNIVSLSVNDFKSFLNMNVHDKRSIIDKIFSLGIINQMRGVVREEAKRIKDSVSILNNQVNLLEDNISKSQYELDKLEKSINESNTQQKDIHYNNLKQLNDKIIKIEENFVKLKSNEEKILKERLNVNEAKNNMKLILRQCNDKDKLYKNDKCPTCMSDLHTSEHKNIIDEWVEKRKYALSEITKIELQIDKVNEISIKLMSQKQKLIEQKTTINNHIKFNNQQIQKLDDIIPGQTESLQNIINASSERKKETIKEKNTNIKKSNFYKVLDEMFGDKGIKQIAIKRILPSLNTEINKLIKELNLEYRVIFDNEFNANIIHLGYPVSVSMLSTGERKKIDFAVLIALIKMMKLKFGNLNLVFLDEMFSSIDTDSIHHVIQILNRMTKEMKLNIFVINHTILPTEMFDYIIDVKKNNGFSYFSIDKL